MYARNIASLTTKYVAQSKGNIAKGTALLLQEWPVDEAPATQADIAMFTHAYNTVVRLNRNSVAPRIVALGIVHKDRKLSNFGNRVTLADVNNGIAALSLSLFVKPVDLYNALTPHIERMEPLRTAASAPSPKVSQVTQTTAIVPQPQVTQVATTDNKAKLAEFIKGIAQLAEALFAEPTDNAIEGTVVPPIATSPRGTAGAPIVTAKVQQDNILASHPTPESVRAAVSTHAETPVFPSGKVRNQRLDLSNAEYAAWAAANMAKVRASRNGTPAAAPAATVPTPAAPKATVPTATPTVTVKATPKVNGPIAQATAKLNVAATQGALIHNDRLYFDGRPVSMSDPKYSEIFALAQRKAELDAEGTLDVSDANVAAQATLDTDNNAALDAMMATLNEDQKLALAEKLLAAI